MARTPTISCQSMTSCNSRDDGSPQKELKPRIGLGTSHFEQLGPHDVMHHERVLIDPAFQFWPRAGVSQNCATCARLEAADEQECAFSDAAADPFVVGDHPLARFGTVR